MREPTPAIAARDTCRACGSADLSELYSLGEQYVNDFPVSGEHRKGVRCPIILDLCHGCTLVQMRHTAPQELLYSGHYWYKSGVTRTMRDALADVVTDCVNRVALSRGDVVIDIGSNDGTLLRCYPRGVVTVGVEPARNLREEGAKGLSIFVPGFWPQDVGCQFDGKAKVVTACGMFYDLEDPNAFIAGVKRVLHPEGLFLAQLMCLRNMVDSADVGNLAHEHLEFYSLKSLRRLFAAHGLELFDIKENSVNGGSYRLFVRHRGAALADVAGGRQRLDQAFKMEACLDQVQFHRDYFKQWVANRDRCIKFVRERAIEGKSVWVYGASTKGNAILQWYGLDSKVIRGAAERSPEKWGRVTVGTGIPIVSEEAARKQFPDFFLVLPYAFIDEFVEREKGQAWRLRGGKFIVPLPEFKVL